MSDVAARDRSRLIDHFKRLYTIIAGLAITEACRKLMPIDPDTFRASSLWMFLAFLVTIVPIFQGGDRSLDLKYLDDRLDGTPHNKWAFVWDVFMLLATALAFVAIAESIPTVHDVQPCARNIMFFFAMASLFLLDVVVLVVDYAKTHVAPKLSSYPPWILLNFLLFAVCLVAGLAYRNEPDASLAKFAASIFVCAFGRTFFDYLLSESFMFP
jgi:cytochrome bd-type quinol oxidase subunit 2